MTRASSLELLLHAYPTVRVDGQARPLTLKRGLALLAHLAEAGRPVSRLQLSTLLWPEADEALGRGRLRRLVHETHAQLGVQAVLAEGDTLCLQSCTSDARQSRERARRLLDAGTAVLADEDIVALLAPDTCRVLDGFEIDAEPFADWLGTHRGEHHRLVVRALQRLAEELAPGVDTARAIEAAQRLIDLDPCSESGHAALLTALGHRGDMAAVDAAYFRCAEVLRSELGVRPSALVEEAFAAARARVRDEPVSTPPRPQPRIRFAQAPEGAVAYSLQGEGPTIVIVPGLLSHLEVGNDDPRVRRGLDRLGEGYRLVMVDRRGTGLSERVGVRPTVASACEDLLAVLDHLGLERAWLFGASVGGTIAMAFAALHPQRVAGLVLYGAGARGAWASDYPWAMKPEHVDQWLQMLRVGWGEATSVAAFAPSAANDPEVHAWWARLLRSAASQNGIADILRGFHEADVRHLLPAVQAPTLVIQRKDDRIVREGAGRHVADHIPGAQWLPLPGADHWWWHGDAETVVDAIRRFMAAHGGVPHSAA